MRFTIRSETRTHSSGNPRFAQAEKSLERKNGQSKFGRRLPEEGACDGHRMGIVIYAMIWAAFFGCGSFGQPKPGFCYENSRDSGGNGPRMNTNVHE